MAVRRNSSYWSNADSFNPDRFPVDGPIPNEVTEAYNYLPFGGGRRKCIGEPKHFSEASWHRSSHTVPLVPSRGCSPLLASWLAVRREASGDLLRKYCRGDSQGDALGGLHRGQYVIPAKPNLADLREQHTQTVSSRASDSLGLQTSSSKCSWSSLKRRGSPGPEPAALPKPGSVVQATSLRCSSLLWRWPSYCAASSSAWPPTLRQLA